LSESDGLVWQFDAAGRLAALEEPNGNRVTLAYNGSGQLTGISHTNGQSFTLEYNAQGRIRRLTDHAGQVTDYAYDASGEHLLTVTAPGSVTTTYVYNSASGATADDYALASITFPDGTHQYYEYDAQGRVSAQSRDGNTERVELTYDDLGSVFVKDAANATTTLRLGVRGELLETQNPLGNRVRFQYDDNFNLISLTAPDRTTSWLSHDCLGNVVQTTDPLGQAVTMGYTVQPSRLDWLRDARGNLTDFATDGQGNLTGITYPDASAEAFGYDAAGNLVSVTNRRSQTITFDYDGLGQITQKTYPDGRTIDYTYDTRGNLTSATDSVTGAITMQYDARGFLTRIDYPGGRWFTFEYNNAGLRTRRTGHDGYVLNYEYDAAGRLIRLRDGANAEIIRYEYDSVGRLSQETKGNGTYTTYGYDSAGRLLNLVNHAQDGTVQSSFDYTYDVNGNRTSMTTLAGTTTYTYDALGQLVGVTYPGGRQVTYAYDAAGNRTTVTDIGVATNYVTNNLNQYTQVGTATYTYDTDGNMASKTDVTGTTTYDYDFENRLISVATPISGTWQYTYDALGNRMAVDHDGTVTRYAHDPIGLVDVAAEYDGGGALVARYVHGFGLVARIAAGGSAAYYAFDGTGHTRQMTDPTGSVANTYDYDPFGIPLQTSETIPNPFRFVGRFGVIEAGNGLSYMRARHFARELGRFNSNDPTGLASGDTNPYTYCFNSTASCTDPLGTFSFDDGLDAVDYPIGLAEKNIKSALRRRSVSYLAQEALRGGFHRAETLRFLEKVSAGLNMVSAPFDGLEAGKAWEKYIYETTPDWITGRADYWDLLRDGAMAWGKTAFAFVPFSQEFLDGWSRIWYEIGRLLSLFDALSSVIQPIDPNEKLGPPGTGQQRSVSVGDELRYTIYFENVMTATAPAQEVVVVDVLDPDLDWTTFQPTESAFGDQVIASSVQAGGFSARVSIPDYRPGENETWWVDITADIDYQAGTVTWAFRTLDPLTGDLPTDPLAGFLPPNDASHRGEGHVSFTIRPQPGLAWGTAITNSAAITFDAEATINTNVVTNTIGATNIVDLPLMMMNAP
jgi:RHS repeat-associated protein